MPFKTIRYLIPILLCFAPGVSAKTGHHLTNKADMLIQQYEVLEDKGYSITQVSTDTALHFSPLTTLSTRKNAYWLRLEISNPYPNNEAYLLSLSLPIHYSLYYLRNEIRETAAFSSRQVEKGVIPFLFKSETTHILYFRINTGELAAYGHNIRPVIHLEKEISAASREKMTWISWIISVSLLLSFAGYNGYVYFQLRDQTYLWYVIMQVGAIIFITSFKHIFNVLLPFDVRRFYLNAEGSVYDYTINTFFLHIGAVIVMVGVLQLTRSYLRTKELLPAYDKILRYMSYGYVICCWLPAIITITGIYYLDSYTLFYDNITVLVIFLMVLFTSITAYRKKIRAARHFLLANILPIIFCTCTAIYFLVNNTPSYMDNGALLPEIAILSQIVTFTGALFARIRTINEELKVKNREVAQLEADILQNQHKHWLIERENEHINQTIQQEKERSELLQQKLDANNRELVSNSLYIHQKNKLLEDLKKQLSDIDALYPHMKHPELKIMRSTLKEHQYLDAEWDKFRLHFENVHPGFFEALKAKHSSLTNNELRLCAYFHINLSTKEIAVLLNIAPASVRQAKTRLNKKLGNPIEVTSESIDNQ
ncbi:7TMR-DISM extracellular 2 [Chitinophaga sp. YR627]|uniref:7TM diverse intracellular signaling domain-containing protein n=1 Tax=Chitinophaga sp. YR627 TaxID=1881041 RepID=UPI0008F4440C|nr:7TM diverse intracellular signaling domain-containing protein [Chitinophaga sp. YR627]SFN92886.1 7TMR-DISM extracellular 2 [Chitinophaga sp. YR627]